jgi:galactose-1-phosphate uridylyltransferase
MSSWRRSIMDIIINDYNTFEKEELIDYDVYEFGVFRGDSMREIASLLNKHKIEVNKFYGFDVFTGMPKETAEPIFQESWDPDILPNEFNVLSYDTSLKTPEDCAEHVRESTQKIFDSAKSKTKVSVIAGLVEETLSKQKDLKPAFYVDFDLDIYSPTKYAFNYLMENNLIVPGTIIGYDDWGGTPDFETFKYGESRAHKEIVDQWGIKMEKLIQNGNQYPHVQTVWIVEEV